MMKSFVALIALTSLLTARANESLARDVVVNAPATVQATQAADLISRAANAFVDYVNACSGNDQEAVARAITSDAVVEYAAAEPGVYLTFDATALTTRCGDDPAPIGAGQHISNLWIFPTTDANAVFVRYDSASNLASAEQHLLLVEMRGDRIIRMRDFTTPSPHFTGLRHE